MTRKIGPLPTWAWIAVAAAVIGGVIILRRQSSGQGTQLGPNVFDPNAVDPNTGLTYGQEMGLGGGGGGAGPSDTGGVTGTGEVGLPGIPDATVPADAGAPQPTPTDLTGGFLDQLTGFDQIAAALGYTKAGPAGKTDTSHPSTRTVKGRTQYWWNGKWHTKPQGQHHGGGKTHQPGRGKGRGHGTKHSHTPGVRKHHRAPSHPHEQVHATSPSHLREPPAHHRHKPKPKPRHRRRRR